MFSGSRSDWAHAPLQFPEGDCFPLGTKSNLPRERCGPHKLLFQPSPPPSSFLLSSASLTRTLALPEHPVHQFSPLSVCVHPQTPHPHPHLWGISQSHRPLRLSFNLIREASPRSDLDHGIYMLLSAFMTPGRNQTGHKTVLLTESQPLAIYLETRTVIPSTFCGS